MLLASQVCQQQLTTHWLCYRVQSVRTKETLPILKAAKRVVLLTGTPALSRPKELFPLLSALVPSSKLTMKAFGERYCQLDPWKQRFGGVYDGECQSIASHKLIAHFLCFAQTFCMHTSWAPALLCMLCILLCMLLCILLCMLCILLCMLCILLCILLCCAVSSLCVDAHGKLFWM